MTSVSHPLLATPQAFAYDAVGNRTTGGSVVNAGNQLTADATHSYQYDDNGNLTRKTLLATGNYSQYTYDAENRLTKVEEFAAGNPTAFATSTYRYDGLGRRTEKVANGQTRRYVYDGEDILLEYDGANALQARYTHGPGIDEPLSRTLFTPPLAAGQTAVLASTADGTGGLVVDDRIAVDGQHFAGFVLDASKPLPAAGAPIDSTGSNLPVPPLDVSSFVTDGQLTVEFVDFGGIRGSRAVYLVVRDSGTNQVVQSQLIRSATPTVYSTHPSGTALVYATQAATTQVAGGTLFYHQDGLGTVTDLTDGAGATAKSYSYDAYGNIVEQTGTVDQPYTYTGRELDSESGLYYYRARAYDPASGRFLQEDPIELAGGMNFYRYSFNNPTNWSDPLGLLSWQDAQGRGMTWDQWWNHLDTTMQDQIDAETIEPNPGIDPVDLVTGGYACRQLFKQGREILIGQNWRIAPFGNRTGHPLGRWPHYHRRGTPGPDGKPLPGEGMNRHRPFEKKSCDTGFCDRF